MSHSKTMRAFLLLAVTLGLFADEPYRVFRGDGTPASLDDILAQAREARVVFLGELHDDPTAHTLELRLLQGLTAQGPTVLALEMFERDVQSVVDEYLQGLITEEHLLASGRAWRNYKSDYRPLVEFAKEKQLPVVAANAPRRYVNRVTRLGSSSLTALSPGAKVSLPPLPYGEASERYAVKFRDFLEKSAQEGGGQRRLDPVKGLAAQSLWDAGMAYSLAESLKRWPDRTAVHVNGSFHSEEHLGILDHLERYRPGTRALVVTMVSPKHFPNWHDDLARKGDFVIVTDPSLPRTPPKP